MGGREGGCWLRPSTFGLRGWQLRFRPAQSQAPPCPAQQAPPPAKAPDPLRLRPHPPRAGLRPLGVHHAPVLLSLCPGAALVLPAAPLERRRHSLLRAL